MYRAVLGNQKPSKSVIRLHEKLIILGVRFVCTHILT